MPLPTSNPLRISVVCRANEVRSRIMEAYLLKRFQHIEVRSFGTEVVKENRISSQLIREMGGWGLEIRQSPPTSFLSELEFVQTSEMVISADHEISKVLSREDISSVNICDFAVDDRHIPLDPLDFRADKYFANAAKVVHCSAKMVSRLFENRDSVNSIWAYASSEGNFPELLRSDAIVIDARLRRSANQAFPSGEIRLFEEREILSGSLLSTLENETKFYAPRYEFSEPEKILLSNDWSDFVRAVSHFGQVNVITAPLTAHGRALSEPYLASLVAEHVEYG